MGDRDSRRSAAAQRRSRPTSGARSPATDPSGLRGASHRGTGAPGHHGSSCATAPPHAPDQRFAADTPPVSRHPGADHRTGVPEAALVEGRRDSPRGDAARQRRTSRKHHGVWSLRSSRRRSALPIETPRSGPNTPIVAGVRSTPGCKAARRRRWRRTRGTSGHRGRQAAPHAVAGDRRRIRRPGTSRRSGSAPTGTPGISSLPGSEKGPRALADSRHDCFTAAAPSEATRCS